MLPETQGPLGDNSNRLQFLMLGGGAALVCLVMLAGAIWAVVRARPAWVAQVQGMLPPTATPVPPPTHTRIPEPTSTAIPTHTPIPPPTAAPTQDQTATAAAESTQAALDAQATQAAEATQQAMLTAAASWPTAWTELFQDNQRRWPEGLREDEYIGATTTVSGSAYRWDVQSYRNFSYWNMLPEQGGVYEDFRLQVGVRFIRGTDDSSYAYGLVFRSEGDQYDFFGISSDRGFRVLAVNAGGLSQLIESGSDLINPAAITTLAVVGQGHDFVCLINDQPVYFLTDADGSGSGAVGLGVDATNPGGQSRVEFSHFTVQAP